MIQLDVNEIAFSDDNFVVLDHCPRNLVTISEVDTNSEAIPGGVAKYLMHSTSTSSFTAENNTSMSPPAAQQSLAWLTLLQNHENKTVEWLVAFR